MFPTLNSLEIEDTLKSGRRHRRRSFLIFINEPKNQESGKVAFIAAKRLGNAVYRNRSKRILREAFRSAMKHDVICDKYNIILMATPNTATAEVYVIEEDIVSIFNRYNSSGARY